MTSSSSRVRAPALRCPFCRENVSDDDDVARACDRCGTTLHAACAADHGCCTSLGCGGSLAERAGVPKRAFRVAPPPPSVAELWGRELAQLPFGFWAILGTLATGVAACGW